MSAADAAPGRVHPPAAPGGNLRRLLAPIPERRALPVGSPARPFIEPVRAPSSSVRFPLVAGAALAVALAGCVDQPLGPPRGSAAKTHVSAEYTPVAIGNLGTGDYLGRLSTTARAINGSGVIVGDGEALTPFLRVNHAFRWTPLSGMQDLTPAAVGLNRAMDVNEAGTIVGVNDRKAFTWTEASGLVLIGALDGDPYGEATAINDQAEVVGFSSRDGGVAPPGGFVGRPFYYREDVGMVPLGSLTDHPYGSPTDINEDGRIVGWAMRLSGATTAFVLDHPGAMQAITGEASPVRRRRSTTPGPWRDSAGMTPASSHAPGPGPRPAASATSR